MERYRASGHFTFWERFFLLTQSICSTTLIISTTVHTTVSLDWCGSRLYDSTLAYNQGCQTGHEGWSPACFPTNVTPTAADWLNTCNSSGEGKAGNQAGSRLSRIRISHPWSKQVLTRLRWGLWLIFTVVKLYTASYWTHSLFIFLYVRMNTVGPQTPGYTQFYCFRQLRVKSLRNSKNNLFELD